MFYVYELADPRTGAAFYVGKGKRNRIDSHELEARKGAQTPKCALIRDIEASGTVIIKRRVSFHEKEDDAYAAEESLIDHYGLCNLTNLIGGGKGGRSDGNTADEDRWLVREICQLLQRVRGKDLSAVNVLGVMVIDMRPALKDFLMILQRIVRNRGLDWVRPIAARQNVVFND